MLLPDLPVVWRDSRTLQVGIDEVTGRLVSAAGPRELAALRSLDGTRSMQRVIADHEEAGGRGDWMRVTVAGLAAAGAVIDAPPGRDDGVPSVEQARLAPELSTLSLARPGEAWESLSRRRQAYVHVRGTGRVGVAVGSLLAAAGVGTIRVSPIAGDHPRVLPRTVAPAGPASASLGQPARTAARDAIGRSSFAVTTRARGAAIDPHLVILCPPRVVAPETVDRINELRLPHLVVISDGPVARVGPLVLPGVTPCLRCLDLHRADRDPRWPLVLSQVAHVRGAHRTATDSVLATLAAGMAVTHALCVIDDPEATAPPSAGALLELRLPALSWTRRAWTPHPECGCLWSPEAA